MAVTKEHFINDTYIATITIAGDCCGACSQTLDGVLGQILMLQTIPAACPAPCACYDIAINDANCFDVALGYLANRSACAEETVVPLIKETINIESGGCCSAIVGGSTLGSPIYHDGSQLTIATTNLGCCAGETTLKIWWRP